MKKLDIPCLELESFTKASIETDYVKPVSELIDYVEYIWMLRTTSDTEYKIIVLPD